MGLTFGRKYDEAPPATSGSGKWIKSFKEGDTRIRFLQEVKDWIVYYEHYNPAGSAFPCTGERDTCPGCTSSNERMKTASRKNAVNALVGGYVDVYKLPVKLTNRLVVRSERNGGTITDRDFVITRIGKDKDTEYDLESLSPQPVDLRQYQLADIEGMLREQFEENFPDFDPTTARPVDEGLVDTRLPHGGKITDYRDSMRKQPEAATEPPPFEQPIEAEAVNPPPEGEVEVTEAELRTMGRDDLLALCNNEQIELPGNLVQMGTPDEIVDYLLENA